MRASQLLPLIRPALHPAVQTDSHLYKPSSSVEEVNKRRQQLRTIGEARFPEHLRAVEVLGLVSIVLLIGLTATGLWEFFFRESAPAWYSYGPEFGGSVQAGPASAGVSGLHGFLSDAAGVTALLGGTWFSYRVLNRLPAAIVVTVCCVTFAAFGGGALRFNLIRQTGVPIEEISAGYTQLFTSDIDFLVTDRGQWGGASNSFGDSPGSLGMFRIMLLTHMLTVPILVGFAWMSIRRGMERRLAEVLEPSKPSWVVGLQPSPNQRNEAEADH